MTIDPKQAHLAELIRAAMESPDAESEVIGPDGVGFRISKHPEPGVKMRMVPIGEDTQGVTVTVWEAAEERPEGYPSTLPFIAGTAASVTSLGDDRGMSVNWWGVDDAAATLEKLVIDSLAAGWQRQDAPAEPRSIPVLLVVLKRQGFTRLIMATPAAGQGMVNLIDQKENHETEAV